MGDFEFLEANIFCMLHNYGEMSAEGIESSLGAGIEEVKEVLFELVLEEKVREVGKEDYVAIDDV